MSPEAKLYDITNREVTFKRMTRAEAFCLGMIMQYIKDNPDGSFATVLVRLIQGDL